MKYLDTIIVLFFILLKGNISKTVSSYASIINKLNIIIYLVGNHFAPLNNNKVEDSVFIINDGVVKLIL